MSDRIELKGIEAFGYHGVFPEERKNGQVFYADILAELDLESASNSDDLNDTVDYGAIVDLVTEDIESDPCQLIEHLGGRIADRILFEFHKINRIAVTIHKPSAPVNGNVLDIAVTIERIR
ncbi:MAG: dihydroneopterin aldolase [Candidatus Nanopelagicaceae bacterium]